MTLSAGTRLGAYEVLYTVSKDDRWICVIRSNDEGDVWLAKLE